jgi:hypothetical protein
MSSKQLHQRKQILVDKKIQYRFAGFVILLAAGTALVTSLAVFFAVLTVLGDKLAAVYPQGRLAPIVNSAYLSFFIVFALSVPLICYFAIRFSFKVVGPLPKIYRYLAIIGTGVHPGKLVLRDGDHLQDLAVAINSMTDELKSRNALQPPPDPTQK